MGQEVDRFAEAGEQILVGPYKTCEVCEGSGYSIDVRRKRWVCIDCDGAGRKLREEYAWACDVLGERSILATVTTKLAAASASTKALVHQANSMRRLKEAEDKTRVERERRELSLQEQWKELATTGRIKNKRL